MQLPKPDKPNPDYIVAPNTNNTHLTRNIQGHDQHGSPQEFAVIEERPLTIFLNSQEILTAMTIGDHPEYLALGFLSNQGMLPKSTEVTGVEHDEETETVVVRTSQITDFENKMAKKTRTSGCAMGTVFGDMMEALEGLSLPPTKIHRSWLYTLSAKINRTPSLYLKAGAIHATVLCQCDKPLVYMEDVGRHNAVDKVAGWMRTHNVPAHNKILYTTGRLTSEMVIKCAVMGIPTLVSRSGFTAWGVDLARSVGLTLIGRLRGERYVCLSGAQRIIPVRCATHNP